MRAIIDHLEAALHTGSRAGRSRETWHDRRRKQQRRCYLHVSPDLEAKTLTVGPTRISVDGKAVEQDDAKSEDSARTLPIPDPLLVELKAAKKRQASEKLMSGAAYADLGYVVCNEAGQPYHPDTLSKMWTKGRRRGRGALHTSARCSAYLRHHDASAGRPGRGDRGLARPRRRSVHDADVRALAARRPG